MTDIINAFYFVTGCLAAFASLRSPSTYDARSWGVIGAGVLSFGILRTAEAGLWTSDYLQRALHAVGLYDDRRPIQVICIGVAAMGLLAAAKGLARQSATWSLRIAASSFCLLALFIAVRSSSFHWSDFALRWHVGSFTVSHLTQLILLATIFSAAFSRPTSETRLNAQLQGSEFGKREEHSAQ